MVEAGSKETRMNRKAVTFPCGQLTLEGSYSYPESKDALAAVVICHPHPLYGGSMNNNVVMKLASVLSNTSIAALMFNFRGVGRSEGSYGGSIGEREDVSAAIDWLLSQPGVDGERIGLAGYSFGAMVGAPVACLDVRVKAVALIAPPLDTEQIELLKKCTIPKLIIGGSEDDVALPEEIEMWSNELPEPKRFHIIEGANHFWQGYEDTVAETVKTFMFEFLC
jgi:alpha/beta superfamily hydrolase